MANQSQARDGRKSLAYILDDFVEVSGATGTLKKGDVVYPTAFAETNSVFGDKAVLNEPFYCVKDYTLAEGDKCQKAEWFFCGQAKGKTLNKTKNTTDVTIDYDRETNYITDGIVSKSGSISGVMLTESLKLKSAINRIKARFGSITEYNNTGIDERMESDTADKDIILIAWNGRDAKSGDLLEVEIIPALFTGCNTGADYGNSQSFDLDYSGNATDERGFKGGVLNIPFECWVVPQMDRPVIA